MDIKWKMENFWENWGKVEKSEKWSLAGPVLGRHGTWELCEKFDTFPESVPGFSNEFIH